MWRNLVGRGRDECLKEAAKEDVGYRDATASKIAYLAQNLSRLETELLVVGSFFLPQQTTIAIYFTLLF